MDVFEAIYERFSVRDYKADQIPDDVMEKLLTSLRYAPSAANKQPWKFIVVKDQETRNKLQVACRGQKWIGDAPVTIVGCGYGDECYHKMGGFRSSIDVDLSIAFDHLTLAATALGLGTCWIGAFFEDQVKEILNIPDDVRVVCITPVGYPTENPKRRETALKETRKPIEDIVCYEKYQD